MANNSYDEAVRAAALMRQYSGLAVGMSNPYYGLMNTQQPAQILGATQIQKPNDEAAKDELLLLLED